MVPARKLFGQRRPLTQLARVVAALCVVGGLGGCRTNALVDLSLRPDGSGIVGVTLSLDRDAARQVDPTTLTSEDLRSAGWTVNTDEQNDGGLVIRIARPVSSAEQASGALGQIGPPFAGVKVRKGANPAVEDIRLSGAVDLRPGLEAFGEDVVKQRTGSPLGLSVEEIARQSGGSIDDVFQIALVAKLGAAPAERIQLPFGQSTPVDVSSRRIAWNIVGPALALLGCVLVGLGARRLR